MNINEIPLLAEQFETYNPEAILRWALDTYYPRIAFASSFGAEDMVLIDMLATLQPDVTIFTLDTGRLHQETYEVMDAVRQKYGITIDIYFPDTKAVEELTTKHGLNFMYQSVDLRRGCCHVRKIEPLNRALTGLDAWITGIRREQIFTRATISKIEVDVNHGCIVKLNPLADWTETQVWNYIDTHQVPYNQLHDRGYPSIGCTPCTRTVTPDEDSRAGRWWWERSAKECGLHYSRTRTE